MLVKVSKRYEKNIVFDEFELNITKGSIHALLGPSGCGKSTLLNCIAGLETYKGKIDIKKDDISYVFQEDRLFPWFTVNKNLKIINNDQSLINHYLRHFKIYDLRHKYPSQLSGGEKQRISIIRSFIFNKSLILLDEPFKSLDYNLKWDLVKMLAYLQKERNNTVLLITHDIDIALYLADTIHVLSGKPTTVNQQINNTNKHNLLSEVTTNNRIKIMNAL